MASHHPRHERPAARSMRSVKAASSAAIPQARPPRHRKTGGLRSPAWARSASRLPSSRSAPSSPKQRSSDHRNALAALEPQPGNYVSPRTTDYVRTSVVELAARSEQAERSL